MRQIRNDSPLHAEMAGELLQSVQVALQEKLGRRVGVGLFIADFGEDGFLGWAANFSREDAITMLLEWIATQEPSALIAAVERWEAQGLLGPERPH